MGCGDVLPACQSALTCPGGTATLGDPNRVRPTFLLAVAQPMPSGSREILLLAMLAMAGCATPALHKGKSPLLPAQMSPDSVVLDMFFVRFPFGDPAVNEKLWEDRSTSSDSPPELRERLARNGFRGGLAQRADARRIGEDHGTERQAAARPTSRCAPKPKTWRRSRG